VIEAMVTGRPRVLQVTTANTGLIPNLPAGAPVEVPCVVDAAGARPLYAGDLPPQCAALNRSFLNVVDLAVRAGVTGDPALVRQALLADPNTAATLPAPRIEELAAAMTRAHAPWLPQELGGDLSNPGR
jgi:alpha-galactosidase